MILIEKSIFKIIVILGKLIASSMFMPAYSKM